MTLPKRPAAPPEIVSASSQESLPKRARDSHDAPERLHGDDGNDDHDDHPHSAFHEADSYGHGDDDRLVSDISERYPEPLPDGQKTIAGPAKTAMFEVENEAPASCRSGRAIFLYYISVSSPSRLRESNDACRRLLQCFSVNCHCLHSVCDAPGATHWPHRDARRLTSRGAMAITHQGDSLLIDFQNGNFFKLKENQEYASRVSDLLIEGEHVIGSYKAIRDGVIFTNKRLIALNVQGITGSRRDYTSLPYSKIIAFSVETAGSFDLDSELDLWFSGLGKVRFAFTGKTNVVQIAKLIAEFTL